MTIRPRPRDFGRALAASLVLVVSACGEQEAAPSPPGSGATFVGKSQSRLDAPIAPPTRGDPAAAQANYEAALKELAVRHVEAALKQLDAANQRDATHLPTLLLLGTLFLDRGAAWDPSRALIACRTALLVAPTNVNARIGEALARVELEDDERAAPLLAALAAEDAAKSTALTDDQRAGVHRGLARLALRAGTLDDALREAELSLHARERDRQTLSLRADILERSGKLAEADADLTIAISLKPDDSRLHFARARVLRRLDRVGDAEREMRICQALQPFDEDLSKAFQSDWPRRIELRRALVAAYPEFRRGRHQLVRELLGGSELAAARTELDLLIAEQPDDVEAFFLLAKVLAKQGDKTAAHDAASRMLATGKTQQAVYDDLLREIDDGAK